MERSQRDGDIYSLLNLVTNRTERYHVKRLKPFLYDNKTDPRQEANRDEGVVDVRKILTHKVPAKDKKKYGSYQFLVEWADGDNPTWLPWKALRTNGRLHEYLQANGMGQWVPKDYALPKDAWFETVFLSSDSFFPRDFAQDGFLITGVELREDFS